MATNEELIVRLLLNVNAFSGFSPHDGKNLLSNAKRVDVIPETVIVHEGDETREFYIVLAGRFTVVKSLSSGKKKIIANLNPGDTFGEMSFLDGRPRAATVIAESNGLLLQFNRTGLAKIPETAAKIYFNLANLMASRVRNTNSLISLAIEGNSAKMLEGVPAEALKTHRNFRNK